jgi:molecular chaperone DnaK (HSP70)
MRLGIDFGTTRTVVAAATQGRYPVATFEIDGVLSEYLPGLAVCGAEFQAGPAGNRAEAAPLAGIRFGADAVTSVESARAVVRSIKRSACQVPHDAPVPELAALEVTSLELLTRYLAFVRRMLEDHSNLDLDGDEPLEAMVAVPANASTRQRYLTLEAFRRAGFKVLGMLNEPTAAAIEFARRHLGVLARRSPKKYVVVYDLGGGTFDSAAVSLEGRRFELISSAGIGRLGGDDFDEEILSLALEDLGVPLDALDANTRVRALDLCRQAKESLQPASRKLLVDLGEVLPHTPLAMLDVADVYARTQPLVDRTLAKLEETFAQLTLRGIDPENPRELGAVYLVGGATAFPSIGRTLRKLYGRKIQLAPQPHAATAIGLAVAADPEADIFVRESATRYFGLWREAHHGHEQVFDPIVTKNQTPDGSGPLVIERHYRPMHAVGHLRFLECTDLTPEGEPSGDLTPWQEILFPYDPSLAEHSEIDALAARRSEGVGDEIIERYVYDLDGTIELSMENRARGYLRKYRLGQLT